MLMNPGRRFSWWMGKGRALKDQGSTMRMDLVRKVKGFRLEVMVVVE